MSKDKARANIYKLLSVAYYAEPELDVVKGLTDLFKIKSSASMADLAEEYTRLFIGPGKHISPYESVHKEGRFYGDAAVSLKNIIESCGLSYLERFSGLPDHISVIFDFMSKLLACKTQKAEKIEEKVLREHVLNWIPDFCDKVIKEARLSFYVDIARITKDFVSEEKVNLRSP